MAPTAAAKQRLRQAYYAWRVAKQNRYKREDFAAELDITFFALKQMLSSDASRRVPNRLLIRAEALARQALQESLREFEAYVRGSELTPEEPLPSSADPAFALRDLPEFQGEAA